MDQPSLPLDGETPEDGSEAAPYDATAFVPTDADLDALRAAVPACRGCPLYIDTTTGVGGVGPSDAAIVLVGEQPGDQEDLAGEAFVGPAGRVLRECLDAAGIDPATVFMTNAVKHFKHHRQGKRRIHDRPTTQEVNACHPWLDAELSLVRPRLIVALGATAARAVVGKDVAIAKARGETLRRPAGPDVDGDATDVYVTYHPSAALRQREPADAAQVRAAIVETLERAKAAVAP